MARWMRVEAHGERRRRPGGGEIDAQRRGARKMSASVERRRARSRTSLSEHRKATHLLHPAQPSPQTDRNLSEKTATNATRTARGESQGPWSHTPPRLAG